MMNHQLVQASIAPFFVLMALTTVLGRVVALKIRANRMNQVDITTPSVVPAAV